MTEQLERVRAVLAGRYAVEHQIGEGGMATVYAARDVRHERTVAIKVLRPELVATIGAERFLAEIRLTAQLTNPRIVPLLDSGAEDGVLYYVMPLIEGETLRDRLTREFHLPVDEAIDLTAQVAAALGYAHERDIVHRDIKPENILLVSGEAIVADFGIARAVREAGGERLTESGLSLGTPTYMSPEQASGQDVDHRTDVYALGCVLYEMLAGEPPYTAPNVQMIFAKKMNDPVPSVRRLRETVPEHVDAAVTRALAKSPVDRFATVSDFVETLTATSAGVQADAFTRWRPALLALALVAFIALLVFGRPDTPVPSQPAAGETVRVAVLPFTVRGAEEFMYLSDGVVDLLSTKLDGAGTWRSIDPRAVLALVEDGGVLAPGPEEGRAIAVDLGAGPYVLGNILEAGGRLQLSATLYDGGGAVLTSASAEGSADAVFALIDDLATQLLVGLSEPGETGVAQIASLTTQSLPALKTYLTGMQDFRAARFGEATQEFQRAVDTDSTFALAWYQLSVTAAWLPRVDLAYDAALRATQFADRLSGRDQRLLDAFFVQLRGQFEQSIELYRGFVDTYPDDVEAWFQLGEVLSHYTALRGTTASSARPAWERLAVLQPSHPATFIHLARIASTESDRQALDSLTRRAIELAPSGDRELEMRALRAFVLGTRGEQEALLADLARASQSTIAEVAWSLAAFVEAAPALRVLTLATDPGRSADLRALGHLWIAHLEFSRGRLSAANAALDALAGLDPAQAIEYRALFALHPFLSSTPEELERLRRELEQFDAQSVPRKTAESAWFNAADDIHPHIRLFLLGMLEARLGDEAAARRRAATLRAMDVVRYAGTVSEDLALTIEAEIAMAAGRSAEALEHLERMELATWYQLAVNSAFYSQVYARHLRGTLLTEVGRGEEALRWFGAASGGYLYEMPYHAPAHFGRAQVFEALGDTERALIEYEEFLALWAETDGALLPFVEQAREQREALTRQAGHP